MTASFSPLRKVAGLFGKRAAARPEDGIRGREAHRPVSCGALEDAVGGATEVVRLNLGCGDKLLSGYINVDVAPARAGRSPDVLCDLRNLHVFESGCADEVMAIHVIEHFYRWEAEEVLREWMRLLRPGGRMVLECPNLQAACEAFLADPLAGSRPDKPGQRTMWVFYGDPKWQDPLMVHRWGYTPESLGELLRSVGLVEVRQAPAEFKKREPRDMRIVGCKPGRADA